MQLRSAGPARDPGVLGVVELSSGRERNPRITERRCHGAVMGSRITDPQVERPAEVGRRAASARAELARTPPNDHRNVQTGTPDIRPTSKRVALRTQLALSSRREDARGRTSGIAHRSVASHASSASEFPRNLEGLLNQRTELRRDLLANGGQSGGLLPHQNCEDKVTRPDTT